MSRTTFPNVPWRRSFARSSIPYTSLIPLLLSISSELFSKVSLHNIGTGSKAPPRPPTGRKARPPAYNCGYVLCSIPFHYAARRNQTLMAQHCRRRSCEQFLSKISSRALSLDSTVSSELTSTDQNPIHVQTLSRANPPNGPLHVTPGT